MAGCPKRLDDRRRVGYWHLKVEKKRIENRVRRRPKRSSSSFLASFSCSSCFFSFLPRTDQVGRRTIGETRRPVVFLFLLFRFFWAPYSTSFFAFCGCLGFFLSPFSGSFRRMCRRVLEPPGHTVGGKCSINQSQWRGRWGPGSQCAISLQWPSRRRGPDADGDGRAEATVVAAVRDEIRDDPLMETSSSAVMEAMISSR